MSTDKLPLDAGSATRPWVDAFADEMEAKLAANRHKGDREGWVTMEPFQLLGRLRDEVDELQETLDALERGRCVCREAGCPHALSQDIEHMRVIAECADVANFAMMIADVAGGMEPKSDSAALSLAAQVERLREALRDCEDWFDQRADATAKGDPPRFVGNPEMTMLGRVRAALAAATAQEGRAK